MKTSPKQFALFCSCCTNLQKFYGLLDWEIRYIHKTCDHRLSWGEQAIIRRSRNHKETSISLFKYWRVRKYLQWKEISDYEIKLAAFHEMTHLLLYDFSWALYRWIPKWMRKKLIDEEHSLIHKLQNILLDEKGDLKW